MGDFGKFLYAVGGDWVGIMSGVGGLAFTVVGVWTSVLSPSAMSAMVYLVIFLVLAICCFLCAVYRAWSVEHQESEKKAERLRPQLEILEKAEKSPGGECHYIQVKNKSALGCQFGLSLTAVYPLVPWLTLPLPLLIKSATPYNPLAILPAGQTQQVLVFTLDNNGRELCITSPSGHAAIPRQPCMLVLCAHVEQGPSVERTYYVVPRGDAVEVATQAPLT